MLNRSRANYHDYERINVGASGGKTENCESSVDCISESDMKKKAWTNPKLRILAHLLANNGTCIAARSIECLRCSIVVVIRHQTAVINYYSNSNLIANWTVLDFERKYLHVQGTMADIINFCMAVNIRFDRLRSNCEYFVVARMCWL